MFRKDYKKVRDQVINYLTESFGYVDVNESDCEIKYVLGNNIICECAVKYPCYDNKGTLKDTRSIVLIDADVDNQYNVTSLACYKKLKRMDVPVATSSLADVTELGDTILQVETDNKLTVEVELRRIYSYDTITVGVIIESALRNLIGYQETIHVDIQKTVRGNILMCAYIYDDVEGVLGYKRLSEDNLEKLKHLIDETTLMIDDIGIVDWAKRLLLNYTNKAKNLDINYIKRLSVVICNEGKQI